MSVMSSYREYVITARDIIGPLFEVKLKTALEAGREIDGIMVRMTENPEPLVLFVGSYSSGKSTIIKRLTGAEFATGINPLTTTVSQGVIWNGFRLVDTPGLRSNQVEHDVRTLSFIGKADIVVWVLEADRLLLDGHVNPFRKVAVELLKSDRLLVVINQMDLAGVDVLDDSEWLRIKRIKTDELRRILRENNIPSGLPIICVAADPDQVADGLSIDEAMVQWSVSPYAEKSHFAEFCLEYIHHMKSWDVEGSNLKGFVDRVYEHMGYVDKDLETIGSVFEKSNELSSMKLNGLHEIEKKSTLRFLAMKANFRRNLNQLLEREIKKPIGAVAARDDLGAIMPLLAENWMGSLIEEFVSREFENLINTYDQYVKDLYEQEENRIAGMYLKGEVAKNIDVISKLFRERPATDHSAPHVIDLRLPKEGEHGELKQDIVRLLKLALDSLPKDSTAYRNVVYDIGKNLGVKFRPWQAVNLGKKIASAMKILPAILAAFEVLADLYAMFRVGKEVERLENKKAEFLQAVEDIEREVWAQVEDELTAYFKFTAEPLHLTIKEERNSIDKNCDRITLFQQLSSSIVDHQNKRLHLP